MLMLAVPASPQSALGPSPHQVQTPEHAGSMVPMGLLAPEGCRPSL